MSLALSSVFVQSASPILVWSISKGANLMNRSALLLIGLVIASVSAPSLARESHHRSYHGGHERGRYVHVPTHHNHYRSHRRHHGAEYLVGGMILGALLNEVSDNSRARRQDVVVVEQPRSAAVPEFLLDAQGQCYAVERYSDRRVLTAVPRSACSY